VANVLCFGDMGLSERCELDAFVSGDAKEWTCGLWPLRRSSQWMQCDKRGVSVEKRMDAR
jgi:hypothetical protein